MKNILLILAAALTLLLTSCTVNEKTGAITVTNLTQTDARGVTVGDLFIGYVPRGSTRTVYFIIEQDGAQISSDNFDSQYGFHPNYLTGRHFTGNIDLKFNHSYKMEFKHEIINTNENIYYIDMVGEPTALDRSELTDSVKIFKK